MDIIIDNDIIGIYSDELNKELHSHHVIQVIASDSPIFLNDKEHNEAVIINSNIKHLVKSLSPCLSLFIDPQSPVGSKLSLLLNEQSYNLLSSIGLTLLQSSKDIKKNITFLKTKLKDIEFYQPDKRIQIALNYIQKNKGLEIQTKHLAEYCFLSESRFIHLFKQEVNLSLHRYITWIKILNAFQEVLFNRYKISDVAYKYNFSDDAHFARTFKRTFGINLKTILLKFKN